jgi:hypothetical protein
VQKEGLKEQGKEPMPEEKNEYDHDVSLSKMAAKIRFKRST